MKISVRPILWNDTVGKLFKRVDTTVSAKAVKEAVGSGKVIIFEVSVESRVLGIFFSRVDTNFDNEKELVCMYAAAAADTPQPFTSVLDPVFDALAKNKGIKFIRIHSDRRGIDKILEKHNYKFIESVFLKEVKNG